MKIALLPNLTRSCAQEVTQAVCRCLAELQIAYYFEEELQADLPTPYKCLPSDQLLSECDAVIAIGGDGSLIHAAKKAVAYKKPVLGVNAGNLAFMAGIEKNELHLLKALIDGSYSIDPRMMLEVTCQSPNDMAPKNLGCCLNDVVVARGEQIKLINLDVYADGKHINHYYSDGIILSTPTGSTAYSLSAGGPVVDPKIESILLTPICTHSLFARSLIFESNSEICVKIPENGEDIYISCDGERSEQILPGSVLTVKKSKNYADFIRIKNDSFIDVLNSKLSQRRA
ncbi:MAG: NAD(+)/NADH kinase [Candidatus Fimenecus sp.]